MRFGLNLLLWTDTLVDPMLPLLDELKEIGYDTVEIPCFDLENLENYTKWGKRFDALGLARTGTAVRGAADNPMSSDPAIRKKGVEANKRNLDCCAAAGCSVMAGPFHSALGYFSGKGPTAEEWKWAVQSMREVAEHAEKVGVTLGLEYLNRFECYLLNTAADGVRFCRDVGHPRCKMMYDTFHAHIEEKSIPNAIRCLKDCLAHVHISENDRSTPGCGNVRWDQNFETLHEIGYNGSMVIEAFGLALEKLVPATKIWRRMYQSERQLATDGLAFMKSEVDKYWGVSPAKWITCERHGRWAAALRREPAAAGVRIYETRSLEDCWQMLADSPASLVVVELTRANCDGLLRRLASLEGDYPLARVAVVAERPLASWEGLIREAGAVWFCVSSRDLHSLAASARRHLDAAPAPKQSFLEQVWADLPWGSGREE